MQYIPSLSSTNAQLIAELLSTNNITAASNITQNPTADMILSVLDIILAGFSLSQIVIYTCLIVLLLIFVKNVFNVLALSRIILTLSTMASLFLIFWGLFYFFDLINMGVLKSGNITAPFSSDVRKWLCRSYNLLYFGIFQVLTTSIYAYSLFPNIQGSIKIFKIKRRIIGKKKNSDSPDKEIEVTTPLGLLQDHQTMHLITASCCLPNSVILILSFFTVTIVASIFVGIFIVDSAVPTELVPPFVFQLYLLPSGQCHLPVVGLATYGCYLIWFLIISSAGAIRMIKEVKNVNLRRRVICLQIAIGIICILAILLRVFEVVASVFYTTPYMLEAHRASRLGSFLCDMLLFALISLGQVIIPIISMISTEIWKKRMNKRRMNDVALRNLWETNIEFKKEELGHLEKIESKTAASIVVSESKDMIVVTPTTSNPTESLLHQQDVEMKPIRIHKIVEQEQRTLSASSSRENLVMETVPLATEEDQTQQSFNARRSSMKKEGSKRSRSQVSFSDIKLERIQEEEEQPSPLRPTARNALQEKPLVKKENASAKLAKYREEEDDADW